ncbi:MAG: hypothetical protein ACREAM_22040, partial [Blastocatellia bacterium]
MKLYQQKLDYKYIINEIRELSVVELEEMIGRGEIRDAKTLVGLFYALSRRPCGARIATR